MVNSKDPGVKLPPGHNCQFHDFGQGTKLNPLILSFTLCKMKIITVSILLCYEGKMRSI